jgi:hypothetical protein
MSLCGISLYQMLWSCSSSSSLAINIRNMTPPPPFPPKKKHRKVLCSFHGDISKFCEVIIMKKFAYF